MVVARNTAVVIPKKTFVLSTRRLPINGRLLLISTIDFHKRFSIYIFQCLITHNIVNLFLEDMVANHQCGIFA